MLQRLFSPRVIFLVVTSLSIGWLAVSSLPYRSNEQRDFDEWVRGLSSEDDASLGKLSISLRLNDGRGGFTQWILSDEDRLDEKRRLLELMIETELFSMEELPSLDSAPHVVMRVSGPTHQFEQRLSQAQVDQSVAAQTVLKLMVLFSSSKEVS
jgi:hypothetical protein